MDVVDLENGMLDACLAARRAKPWSDYEAIKFAILAERKRCAEHVQRDHENETPLFLTLDRINSGEQP